MEQEQEKLPLGFIDNIIEVWGHLVSWVVVFLMLVTLYDVVARYAFNRPTFWAFETTEMMYAFYIIIGAAYTLRYGAFPRHIKMDVLYDRFSPRTKLIIDIVAFIFFFIWVGVIVWQGWEMAWRSLMVWEHRDSSWGPPVYPVKFFIPIGTFLFFVQGVVVFIRKIMELRALNRKEATWAKT